MSIEFTCAHCGKSFRVDDEKVGKTVLCNECDEILTFPAVNETRATVVPVIDEPNEVPTFVVVPKSSGISAATPARTAPVPPPARTPVSFLTICLVLGGLVFFGMAVERWVKASDAWYPPTEMTVDELVSSRKLSNRYISLKDAVICRNGSHGLPSENGDREATAFFGVCSKDDLRGREDSELPIRMILRTSSITSDAQFRPFTQQREFRGIISIGVPYLDSWDYFFDEEFPDVNRSTIFLFDEGKVPGSGRWTYIFVGAGIVCFGLGVASWFFTRG